MNAREPQYLTGNLLASDAPGIPTLEESRVGNETAEAGPLLAGGESAEATPGPVLADKLCQYYAREAVKLSRPFRDFYGPQGARLRRDIAEFGSDAAYYAARFCARYGFAAMQLDHSPFDGAPMERTMNKLPKVGKGKGVRG